MFSNNDKIATVPNIAYNGFYNIPFCFFDENFNCIESPTLYLSNSNPVIPIVNDDWNLIVDTKTLNYTPTGGREVDLRVPTLKKITKAADTGTYSLVELSNFSSALIPLYYPMRKDAYGISAILGR